MLADTDQNGLFNVLARIRWIAGVRFDEHSQAYGKPGSLAEGMLCVWCNSIWFGVLVAAGIYLNPELTFFVSLPFALSAAAVFIENR